MDRRLTKVNTSSVLLTAAMVLLSVLFTLPGSLPMATASAAGAAGTAGAAGVPGAPGADNGDCFIDLADNTTTRGTGWSYDTAERVFTVTGDVTITGKTAVNRVVVDSGGLVNITLSNADIDMSAIDNTSPFFIEYKSSVNLTLDGMSSLKGGSMRPGLELLPGRVLVIGGTGMLNAAGGERGAGIGGRNFFVSGSITINSGTVNATGGTGAAGIGGGAGGLYDYYRDFVVVINGGTVNATGGTGAADIGGGAGGVSGSVFFDGGDGGALGGLDERLDIGADGGAAESVAESVVESVVESVAESVVEGTAGDTADLGFPGELDDLPDTGDRE